MNVFTVVKNNKWISLVLIVFVLLLIPFLLFLVKGRSTQSNTFSSQSNTNELGSFFSRVFPTPTPFESTPLSIVSTYPADQDTDINPEVAITVTFSKTVSLSEQKKIAFRISPNASGSASWNQDKTTFTFTPTFPLLQNASYAATIIFDSTSSPWSFTTSSLVTETPGDIKSKQIQTTLDNQWDQYQQSIQDNYPWYNSLPLQGDRYFVTFDTYSTTFTADLYPDQRSENEQVNQMKQEIQSQLAKLGVDLQKYPIIWNITAITPTPAP